MRYSDYEIFLATVKHSGTRAVRAQLRSERKRFLQCHTIPEALIYAEQLPAMTTLRDPKLVAQSWIKNAGNRFVNKQYDDDWEEQWTIWHTLVTQFDAEVVNIATSGLPVVGAHRDQTAIPDEDLPWDKIEFANNLITDAGLIL